MKASRCWAAATIVRGHRTVHRANNDNNKGSPVKVVAVIVTNGNDKEHVTDVDVVADDKNKMTRHPLSQRGNTVSVLVMVIDDEEVKAVRRRRRKIFSPEQKYTLPASVIHQSHRHLKAASSLIFSTIAVAEVRRKPIRPGS
jgi:hypothetical protein